jgi:protein-disulfide isomerase
MSDEHTTQESTPSQKSRNGQSLGVPVAIVIAAVLIAGAIYLKDGGAPKTPVNVSDAINGAQQAEQVTPETTVAPVTEADHIRGNPNAPIMVIEYSDYDCPFCKNFHETMNRIMEEYGATGKVAWVYRQFPIAQLHPNAPKISEAAECVADLGGDEAFWKFSDLVFGEREVNAPTDMTKLPQFAVEAGVDKSQYELCFNSGKFTEKVAASIEGAVNAGARGTPYSIVMVGDQQAPINGAQPYEVVKGALDSILSQLGEG